MDDDESLHGLPPAGARPSEPLWTLSCGKRVSALSAHLPSGCASIADVPNSSLRFEHFTVSPEAISGWATMTKAQLKREMVSYRGELYRKEKERRLLQRVEGHSLAASGISAAVQSSLGLKRLRDSSAPSDAGGCAAAAATSTEAHDALADSLHAAKRARAQRHSDFLAAASAGIRVVLDCSFDHLMSHKEIVSLSMQVASAIALNARAGSFATGSKTAVTPAPVSAPLRLLATSVDEERLLAWFRGGALLGWGVDVFQGHFAHVLRAAGWRGASASSSTAASSAACSSPLASDDIAVAGPLPASSASPGAASSTAYGSVSGSAVSLRDFREQLPAILQSRRERLGLVDSSAAASSCSTSSAAATAAAGGTAESSCICTGATPKWAAAEPAPSATATGASSAASASTPPSSQGSSGFVLPTALHRLPPPQRVVYLSADSDTVLTGALDPATVYVVGGIVDRNRHKGLSARVAGELGLATARFPIEEEGVKLSSCTVLTTMHGAYLILDAEWIDLRRCLL